MVNFALHWGWIHAWKLSFSSDIKCEYLTSLVAWNTVLEMEVKKNFIKFCVIIYEFNWQKKITEFAISIVSISSVDSEHFTTISLLDSRMHAVESVNMKSKHIFWSERQLSWALTSLPCFEDQKSFAKSWKCDEGHSARLLVNETKPTNESLIFQEKESVWKKLHSAKDITLTGRKLCT